jgi:hypothetical protein
METIQKMDFAKISLKKFCVIVIILANSIQFSFNPSGTLVGDSKLYGAGHARDWGLLSFTGNSVRNWPLVLINTILEKQTLQVLFQFITSTFAWSILILTVSKYFSNRYRNLALIALTSLAISPQILTWNSTLLAETYGISGIVLIISTTFRLIIEKSKKNLYQFLLVLYIWANLQSRNYYFLLLSLVLASILFFNFFKKLITIKTLRLNIIPIFIISILFFQSAYVNFNQINQFFAPNITYQEMASFYTFAGQPEAKRVRESILGVPEMQCIKGQEYGDIIKLSQYVAQKCPETSKWLQNKYKYWYLHFLLSHPDSVLRFIATSIISGNAPNNMYSSYISILPGPIDSLFFGDRNVKLSNFSGNHEDMPLNSIEAKSPFLLWIFLFCYISFFTIKNYRKAFRSGTDVQIWQALIFFGIISLIGISLVSVINPAEHFKITIQYFVLFMASSILLPLSINIKSKT